MTRKRRENERERAIRLRDQIEAIEQALVKAAECEALDIATRLVLANHLAVIRKTADDRRKQVEKKMRPEYCRWRMVDRAFIGKVNIYARYTTDKCGEGWYHWKIDASQKSNLSFGGMLVTEPYDTNKFPITGKYRTRKAAKARALKEFDKVVVQLRKKSGKRSKTKLSLTADRRIE